MAICPDCGTRHHRWRDKAHTKPAAYCRRCHRRRARESRERRKAALLRKFCPDCMATAMKLFHVTPLSHRRNR